MKNGKKKLFRTNGFCRRSVHCSYSSSYCALASVAHKKKSSSLEGFVPDWPRVRGALLPHVLSSSGGSTETFFGRGLVFIFETFSQFFFGLLAFALEKLSTVGSDISVLRYIYPSSLKDAGN